MYGAHEVNEKLCTKFLTWKLCKCKLLHVHVAIHTCSFIVGKYASDYQQVINIVTLNIQRMHRVNWPCAELIDYALILSTKMWMIELIMRGCTCTCVQSVVLLVYIMYMYVHVNIHGCTYCTYMKVACSYITVLSQIVHTYIQEIL